MIRKYMKRYHEWQEHVRLSTPFVILCGSVAIIYLFYRLTLILFPAVALEQAAFHPGMQPTVCSQDDKHLQDPAPILSASYQRRVQQQNPAGPNLVTNADLTHTDPTGQPIGYEHAAEGKGIEYDVHEEGKRFLRVTTKKKITSDSTAPAWQMDRVSIKKNKTYAYSFWYRSSEPTQITTEYQVGKTARYKAVTTLQAADTWQQFAAHFDNDKDAKNFRVNLAPTKPGRLDMRDFAIHRIPDAQLASGIVTLAFDDGWQSVADKAVPLLSRYGIRTTQYIISDIAGTTPDYMNFAVLSQMKKQGHEIGSHSLTHCDQTQLNPIQLQDNAVKSKQLLEAQNLGPIKSFAYPLGEYDAKSQAIFIKQYPLIRTSDFGYNDRYFDETTIHSITILATTSDKEVQGWLDYAKKHRLWLVLTYHRIDAAGEYSVTSAQLERQLQMIRKSGLEVLPLSEAAVAARK